MTPITEIPPLEARILRTLALTRRGVLTPLEMENAIIKIITPENIVDVMQIIPEELRERIRKYAQRAPRTEQEWDGWYDISSYCGPELSAEEWEAAEKRRRSEGHAQVEAIRRYFALGEGGSR